MERKPKLHVLPGGSSRKIRIRGSVVVVGPEKAPPFPVNVRVFEEDTYLVLSVDPVFKPPAEHPVKLITSLYTMKPRVPGSVVRNGNSWYAVVYNLDYEVFCQERWVVNAYKEIFSLAEKYGIRTLGLPLLGSVHGDIAWEKSLALLLASLEAKTRETACNVWIIVPEGFYTESKQLLGKYSCRQKDIVSCS